MNESILVLDIEVLPNYFLVIIKSTRTGKIINIEMSGRDTRLPKEKRAYLHSILMKYTSVGFNSLNYDIPLIEYALQGATCYNIYKVSKDIVENGRRSWYTYKNYEIRQKNYDHIDLIEPAPAVMIGLKAYGTRIGSKRLKEFYLNPNDDISEEDIEEFRNYCINDVQVTEDLFKAVLPRIELREQIMEQYRGIEDLRSKSDSQIAEAIFKYELKLDRPKAANVPSVIEYVAPEYIEFESDDLNELLQTITAILVDVNQGNGQPQLQKEWTKLLKVKLGATVYKLGLGGIHSQEKKLVVESNSKYILRNADISSMYPSILITLGLYPKSCGANFINIYKRIYNDRLEAKAKGDKVVSDSLKIVLNGSYGKLGSKYSFLYAPHLMLAVTLTGQLMMLMLIEQLENKGFRVVSSNTDGIEVFVKRDRQDEYEAIIFDWELATGMSMEHGAYLGLYAKDVNNYIAKYDGYVKAKGLYAPTTLMKGRATPIAYEAIREYINSGKSLESTIRECKDVNEFVTARTVKGGACYKGEPIGKMVRWYWATDGNSIHYCSNGNLVPKTAEGNGVVPIMDLTDDIPTNLDYNWYINEAILKLKDLGVDYAYKR